MYETLGLEIPPRAASVGLALVLGLVFGILAERTAFCLRRALVGVDRPAALAVWLSALAAAVFGTQAAVAAGLVSFDDHRFHSDTLPLAILVLGGLMFGAGMVLARGCASRLTVLAGTGNLRALVGIVTFALFAQATLRGVFAPLRTRLAEFSVDIPSTLPFGALPWLALVAVVALWAILRGGRQPGRLAMAAVLGLLVPLGWVGTGYVLYDDFDPIALESLSFTAPAAETLFWSGASTAVPATFGTGLIGGVLLGALAASLLAGSFRWQSFDSPAQTGGSLGGGALMGVGGVLAGGCTVGAGLSGIATLSLAAVIALAAIVAGAYATCALQARISAPSGAGYAGSSTTQARQPAE